MATPDVILSIGADEAEAKKGINAVAAEIENLVKTALDIKGAFHDSVDQLTLMDGKAGKVESAISDTKTALAQLVLEGKKGTAEYDAMTAALKDQLKVSKDIKDAIEEIEKSTTKAVEKLDKFDANKLKDSFKEGGGFANPLGGIAGALDALPPQAKVAAAGLAVVVGGVTAAVNASKEFQETQRQVSLQTGLTGEALEGLADQARNAYAGGVGESLSDALKQAGSLKQILGDSIPETGIAQALKEANQVSKTMGVETPELLEKIKPLIKQYNLTVTEALAKVSATAADGVGDIGGLLDAYKEFTPSAKEAGLSVDEFSARLSRGAKNGVFDLGKVGDGYKNLTTLVQNNTFGAVVSEITGKVGEELQQIARLANEGQLTADEAGKKTIEVLDKAAKAGEISAATQKQVLVGIYGSVAEDVGTDQIGKIFGGDINEAEIKANAEKAGKAIQEGIGAQDPMEKLSRSLDVFLEGAGKPILTAFNEIGKAIGKIFGDVSDSGDGLQKFGEVIGTVFVNVLKPITAVIDIIGSLVTIAKAGYTIISNALSGINIKDIFGEDVANFISGIGDSFSGLGEVIEALLNPIGLISDAFAFLAGEADKVAGKSNETAKKATEEAKKSSKDLQAEAVELAKKNNLSNEAVAELAKKYGVSTEEAKKLVDTSAEVGQTIKQAVLDTQNLANSFNNAVAATSAVATNNSAARAQIKQDLADARAAAGKYATMTKEEREKLIDDLIAKDKELEAQQVKSGKEAIKQAQTLSRTSLAGNTERQKNIKATTETGKQESKKAEELITANAIANARDRARKILEIEQKYSLEAINLAITKAAAVEVEDFANKKVLQLQKETLLKENAEATKRLEASFQAEDLQKIIDAEQAKTDATLRATQDRLDAVNRVIERGGANVDLLKQQADIQREQLSRQAEQDAKAYIQSLAEFTAGKAIIDARVEVGELKADQAKTEVDALTKKIADSFNDVKAGGDVIADSYKAIFTRAGVEIESINRELEIATQRLTISADTDLIRRGYRLTLLDAKQALKERLKEAAGNVALERRITLDWFLERKNAEQSYLAETSGIYKAALDLKAALEEGFTQYLTDTTDGALKEQQDKYKEFIDGLNKQLKSGEAGWREYTAAQQAAFDKLGESSPKLLEQIRDAFLGTVGNAANKTFTRLSAEQKKLADDSFLLAESNNERISQLEKDRTALQLEEARLRAAGMNELAGQALQEYTDLTNEQAKLQEDNAKTLSGAFESLGLSAAAAFGALAASGELTFKSIVGIALDSLQSLVPILVAQITGVQLASPNPANALSFGAAGIASALGLTALLQGLVAAARAAVKLNKGAVDLGLNGNPSGIDTIPAFLNEGESVATTQATRARGRFITNKEVLRHINRTGGAIETFVIDNIFRDRIKRGLMLDKLGITFDDDLHNRGYQIAATMIQDTSGLAHQVALLTAEVRSLKQQIRSDVNLNISAKIDKGSLISDLEFEEYSRVKSLG